MIRLAKFISASLLISITLPCTAVAADAQLPVPILDCTVRSAHGSFNSYSVAIKPGDKLELNVNALLAQKMSMLNFSAKRKYVSIAAPFKVVKRLDSTYLEAVRLECSRNDNDYRLDLRAPTRTSNSWDVYFTYQYRGIVTGVMVLSGDAHQLDHD